MLRFVTACTTNCKITMASVSSRSWPQLLRELSHGPVKVYRRVAKIFRRIVRIANPVVFAWGLCDIVATALPSGLFG